MGRDRYRVLTALSAYLVLIVGSMFVLDWFVMTATGELMMGRGGTIGIDLRSVTVCTDAGPCVSVSFSGIPNRGMYPTIAFAAFWGTILVSLVVVYKAGVRILTGQANDSQTRTAIFGALAMAAVAGAAGFLFGPEIGAATMGVTIERTWAPAMLVLGHLLGAVTLHLAATESPADEAGDAKPTMPTARAVPRTGDIARDPSPAVAPIVRPLTGPVPRIPDQLLKKVKFTALAAEVTRAGIDARREDGSTVLVMWSDVVGVVARRLPPEHEGATFVDIVSTPGSTLRILPWTRITGDVVRGTDDERARALIAFALTSCPTMELDARTHAFSKNGEAAQLPDLGMLAAHDARLA